MLGHDCDFVGGVLGQQQSCSQARHASAVPSVNSSLCDAADSLKRMHVCNVPYDNDIRHGAARSPTQPDLTRIQGGDLRGTWEKAILWV